MSPSLAGRLTLCPILLEQHVNWRNQRIAQNPDRTPNLRLATRTRSTVTQPRRAAQCREDGNPDCERRPANSFDDRPTALRFLDRRVGR
jgi:hypothetical protein